MYHLPFDFSLFILAFVAREFFINIVLAYFLLSLSFGAKFCRWIAGYSILRLDAVRVINDIIKFVIDFLHWFKTAFFVKILRLVVDHSFGLRFLFPFVDKMVGGILLELRDGLDIHIVCECSRELLLIHEWCWLECWLWGSGGVDDRKTY